MTPRDVLARLEAEGITASLKLSLECDTQLSPETVELARCYRDDLLTYLTMQLSDTPQMCRLSEQLQRGAVWCKRCYRFQLHPCVPSEKQYK